MSTSIILRASDTWVGAPGGGSVMSISVMCRGSRTGSWYDGTPVRQIYQYFVASLASRFKIVQFFTHNIPFHISFKAALPLISAHLSMSGSFREQGLMKLAENEVKVKFNEEIQILN